MGYFLRHGSCRLSKLVVETIKNKNGWTRNICYFPRYYCSGKSPDEEATFSKMTSPHSKEADDGSADSMKFENVNKMSLPRSTVKSEDFAIGPQNDPNTFGTLSPSNRYLLSVQEGASEDQSEDKYISELPNYLPQKEYADMIKKYLNQRRFTDALNVLEVTMLKEHRIKPEYYIYAILISFCGKTGYSKMAFKLYNDMKKRDLKVTSSIYTSLFNSYANSPFPSDGLRRTKYLFSLMNEKGDLPNQITCHAIIKAFARCGSVEDAFKVADYMMEKNFQLQPETMSFLFHACISDKETGFRHALLVYRKMLEYKIKPDVIHFNLILHCIRDCSIGNLTSMIDVLKKLGVENADKLAAKKEEPICLQAGHAWEEDEKLSASVVSGISREPSQPQEALSSEMYASTKLLPNLFSYPPTLGCIVSLSDIAQPQDRLFLLGGMEGFLQEMNQHGAKSDIKTVNLLLDCSPQTYAAEQAIMRLGTKLGLTLDLLFLNSLIRRRCHRGQYTEAKEVLPSITAHGFQPDLMTFTNLAMACRHLEDAKELLKSMDECGLRPGIELVTNLFGCASCNYNMRYVQLVLDVIEYEEMKVNRIFLRKIDDFNAKCQRVLKIRPPKFTSSTLDALNKFCIRYPKWKEAIEVEEEKHPWQHLREKHAPDSKTDEEFFSQYVEKEPLRSKFSRLGPSTPPIIRKAKLKKLKEENPEHRQQWRRKTNVLDGIGTVTYQKLLPK